MHNSIHKRHRLQGYLSEWLSDLDIFLRFIIFGCRNISVCLSVKSVYCPQLLHVYLAADQDYRNLRSQSPQCGEQGVCCLVQRLPGLQDGENKGGAAPVPNPVAEQKDVSLISSLLQFSATVPDPESDLLTANVQQHRMPGPAGKAGAGPAADSWEGVGDETHQQGGTASSRRTDHYGLQALTGTVPRGHCTGINSCR